VSVLAIVPFIVFALVLPMPVPARILFASFYSVTPVVLPLGVALWLCYRRRSGIATIAALTVTMVLFALPLASLWQHFGVNFNAIGGLLPFSDASGYYYDAQRLLDGHPLGWSARRPLFVGLLATLLRLTGRNLQITLAVFVALNGFATYLLARELRNSHGPAAAAVATVMMFLFYRVQGGCGAVLTENLGFAMGAVAFALLWRAARDGNLTRVAVGMGLLTTALMARAGAFFVLPALVGAFAWIFRSGGRALSAALTASAAVALAAALGIGLGRVLADPASPQTTFSNFSYSLYGLVVGGAGWQQALADHPDAREGAEIYTLAFDAFLAHPEGLLKGSLRMWRAYLWPAGPVHAFAFVTDGARSPFWQLLCFVFSGCGLVAAVRRYQSPQAALLLAGTIGHLASIPFAPPIDADLRVYAATMPIVALLVGTGAAVVLSVLARRAHVSSLIIPHAVPEPTAARARSWSLAEAVALSLTVVVFLGPLWVFYTSHVPAVIDVSCVDDARSLQVRVSPGSFLRITEESSAGPSRVVVPDVRPMLLSRTVEAVELRHDAARFTAGHALINAYDLKTGRLAWVLLPIASLSKVPAMLHICGHDSADALSRQYGLVYADTVILEQASAVHLPVRVAGNSQRKNPV
jgi:hypothetical protein